MLSAEPGVRLENVAGADLDPTDSISVGSDGSVNLVANTSFGMDGVTFETTPGAIVTADVLLDGVGEVEAPAAALGPGDDEQVREPVAVQAEERPGALGAPLVP